MIVLFKRENTFSSQSLEMVKKDGKAPKIALKHVKMDRNKKKNA